MKRFFGVALLLLSALSVFRLAAGEGELFRDGERVTFLGDSITHGGGYLYNIELFQALRKPGSRVTVLNGGISGDSASGGLRRLDYDILADNPDTVFVMFGMNDVGRHNYRDTAPNEATQEHRKKSLDNYRKNMSDLLDAIAKAGKTAILITPTPYDQYSELKTENLAACNEPGLAECARIGKELAAERKLKTVDFFTPMTELLKKYPEQHLSGGDRVHPGGTGHMLMTAILLREMGGAFPVATVSVDAKAGTVQAENAEVTGLSADDRGVSFSYAPKALPFPSAGSGYRAADTIYPVTEIMNRETLTVRNLAPGKYVLKTGDTAAGTFDAAELAAGVNLALLETPSRKIAEAANQIEGQIRSLAGHLRQIAMVNRIISGQGGNPADFENSSAVLDQWLEKLEADKNPHRSYYRTCVKDYKTWRPQEEALKKQLAELREKLWTAARPVPFTLSLTPAPIPVSAPAPTAVK